MVVLPFLRPLRAVRALRGLRGLSGLRALQASRLVAFLGTGLGHAREILRRRGLHYVLVVVVAVMFAAAGLEVVFEAHARGGTIHNYGDALWWAVVTVTSVGYGDKFPVTAAGPVRGHPDQGRCHDDPAGDQLQRVHPPTRKTSTPTPTPPATPRPTKTRPGRCRWGPVAAAAP